MSNNYYRPSGFGGFSFFPPVLKNLLIINGVVFLIQMLGQNLLIGDMTIENYLIKYFSLIPIGYGFLPWQLITYQFMHGGFGHIFFNMFALWMFGVEIENLWGSKKFLIFYLSCGVAAGLAQLFITPMLSEAVAPTIGASGAIFGVLIAFAMLFPERYIYLYFFIPVKAKYLIAFMILIEFFAVDSASSNVAHLAHLGGALAGFIYIMYDRKQSLTGGNLFGGSSPGGKINNPFSGMSNPFSKKDEKIQDAKFYEINDENEKVDVSQKEIDAILDKISQSGYQNLSDKEKRILFEASKKDK
ncbi:MAG TPA: rhomboid family intramembrane serine protease [Ignavibacteriaceae bacterium]|nr:rhomboid family intramembrane serine protease [Ignavibacteriaceae bacterium]